MAAFMCLVNGIFKEEIGAGIETRKNIKHRIFLLKPFFFLIIADAAHHLPDKDAGFLLKINRG